MKWTRINARPATAAELRANIAKVEGDDRALAEEAAEAQALPADDPQFLDAQRRLPEIARDREAYARTLAALRATLAEREAEAAKAEREARHAAEEKQASADVKIARDLDAAIERTAKLRAELAASVARTAAWNLANPDLQIVDSETRFRRIPGRAIPAEYRDEIVWQNAAGERPSFFGQDPSTGEMIPVRGGYTKQKVRVCVREEETIYPRMPERWATALVLVDREGRKL